MFWLYSGGYFQSTKQPTNNRIYDVQGRNWGRNDWKNKTQSNIWLANDKSDRQEYAEESDSKIAKDVIKTRLHM